MSDQVQVRLAEPGDLAAVGDITVRGYGHDGFITDEDDYVHELADSAGRAAAAEVYVALRDGKVVGTVTFCPPGSPLRELSRDGEGEFRMLAVDPEARRLGVGGALVRHCFDRCAQLDLTSMVICSMKTMTTAHALYAAFGFERDPSLDWQPVPGVTLLAFRASV